MMQNIKRFIPFKSKIKKGVSGGWNSFLYMLCSSTLSQVKLSSVSKIHFVCTGNICRSAFAEKLTAMKFNKNNIPVPVISSGIETHQGDRPPNDAIDEAKKWGIDLSSHVPKQISKDMMDHRALLIGMHYSHYKQLNALCPEYKNSIYLIKHFARKEFLFIDLHDPYGCSQEVFNQCFWEINVCVDGLISKLMRN